MGRREESSRKRQNVDRLSSLPDSIICHILSFLPTKLSMATSILARRWRFLWMDVPNIHLDFHSPPKRYRGRPRTSDIINAIFEGHNIKALDTFRFGYTISNANDKLTQDQLESWIAAVIARKVRNIELEFSDFIKMPECLFTYKSLVELRLYKCLISISLPASICFPTLEKLHLCYVEYNNDKTFQHLISACLILEELRVIEHGGVVCSRISSPTLKWLAINFRVDGINFRFGGQDRLVEIITPALRYLQVRGCSSRCKILTQALSSLTEADIELVHSRSLLELLDRMSNIRCLRLKIYWGKFSPSSALSVLSPRFHKLTKLELAADWRLISKFLEITDNLEVLDINLVYRECWVEPQQVFTCLQSHLTSIVINSFSCEEHEYALVRYLLKNAKVLTNMKIRCAVNPYKEKIIAMERILLFERGSEACKLDFY